MLGGDARRKWTALRQRQKREASKASGVAGGGGVGSSGLASGLLDEPLQNLVNVDHLISRSTAAEREREERSRSYAVSSKHATTAVKGSGCLARAKRLDYLTAVLHKHKL